MLHPAMSLRDRILVSRKGGTGGVGRVNPKGVNSVAMSGLALKSPWLEPGGPFI